MSHASRASRNLALGVAAIVILAIAAVLAIPAPPQGPVSDHGHLPPWWPAGCVPFAALLLCIALLPLIPRTAGWWHANHNKLAIALTFGAATMVHLGVGLGWGPLREALMHGLVGEYLPFIILLLTLYVIGGGVSLDLRVPPSSGVNTAILAVGAILANVIGTTGASMLLIRPLLQVNAGRRRKVHTVVFFIFLVSNVGGCLLPIGDPPLFLGYLRGVPFFWTLKLWPQWVAMVGALLAAYYVMDTIIGRRDRLAAETEPTAAHGEIIRGSINFLWLVLAVAAVATVSHTKPLPLIDWTPFFGLREIILLALCGLSLRTTPAGLREESGFSWFAILEVAALFVGIFITMQIPLAVLAARGGELGITSPMQFFWGTGILSSVLDNAPTYQVFLQTAIAIGPGEGGEAVTLLTGQTLREDVLVAISLGAVFMGANTYIGNGPNFMVRSIAEEAGVAMPSFFGYMLWSGAILLPAFVVMSVVVWW